MEDLLYFIFILIVFLGPLMKKFFEALAGEGVQQKKPSREEVREYLEKMRSSRQQSNQNTGYQAPVSRPKKPVQQPYGNRQQPYGQQQAYGNRQQQPYGQQNAYGNKQVKSKQPYAKKGPDYGSAKKDIVTLGKAESQFGNIQTDFSSISDTNFDRIENVVEQDILSRGNFDRIEKSVERNIGADLSDKAESKNFATPSAVFTELIHKKNYSEFQKAIILSEIFGKPKGAR